jgi:hypothetical protein
MLLDAEIAPSVRPTIGTRKPALTLFFNSNHFMIMDLLLEDAGFTVN